LAQHQRQVQLQAVAVDVGAVARLDRDEPVAAPEARQHPREQLVGAGRPGNGVGVSAQPTGGFGQKV